MCDRLQSQCRSLCSCRLCAQGCGSFYCVPVQLWRMQPPNCSQQKALSPNPQIYPLSCPKPRQYAPIDATNCQESSNI